MNFKKIAIEDVFPNEDVNSIPNEEVNEAMLE